MLENAARTCSSGISPVYPTPLPQSYGSFVEQRRNGSTDVLSAEPKGKDAHLSVWKFEAQPIRRGSQHSAVKQLCSDCICPDRTRRSFRKQLKLNS